MAGLVPSVPSLITSIGAVLGLVALVLTCAGLLRLSARPIEPWPAGETLVKTLYGLGLALPGIALAGYGMLLAQPPTLPGIAGLLVVVLGVAYGRSRRDRTGTRQIQRWSRLVAWLDPVPLYAAAWKAYRAAMNLIRRVGEAVEGEGAFLWVLVALLAVALVMRGGTP